MNSPHLPENNGMPSVFHVHTSISTRRKLQVWSQWAVSLLPMLLILLLGLFLFRQEIVNSVLATPHPELVYAIAAAFLVGVLLTCAALYRYTLEANLIDIWEHTPVRQRKSMLQGLPWSSDLTPLYEILAGHRPLTPGAHQAVLEHEIDSIEARLGDRLSLPQYLAGALVGLGLVGTFIGLLGTLEDLGKLFGTLVSAGSDTAVSPTDMFSDMVKRLQDPMRGMGTAFVASLYGLLGSLVLGLQILMVGKAGQALNLQMHSLIRSTDAIASATPSVQAFTPGEIAPAVKIDTQAAFHILHAAQAAQVEQARRWEELTQEMKAQQARNLEELQLLRREILGLVESNKSVTLAIHENIKADDRYRKAVPKTTYWQEAWVKVQAYLQRSSNDEALTQLGHIARLQNHSLIDIAASLGRIDQRLTTHLEQQFMPPNKRV